MIDAGGAFVVPVVPGESAVIVGEVGDVEGVEEVVAALIS